MEGEGGRPNNVLTLAGMLGNPSVGGWEARRFPGVARQASSNRSYAGSRPLSSATALRVSGRPSGVCHWGLHSPIHEGRQEKGSTVTMAPYRRRGHRVSEGRSRPQTG